MAQEYVRVIDPDLGTGAHYDSLYDWEAAQQGDLTGVRDEIAVAKCRCTNGTADTTEVTVDGWTTSATQYIKIWADTSESYRHNGTYQTGNKYRFEYGGASDPLIFNEDYIEIEGISFKLSGSSTLYFLSRNAAVSVSNLLTISKCLVWSTNTNAETKAVYNLGAATNSKMLIVNSIIYGSTSTQILVFGYCSTGTITVYNSTLIGATYAIYRGDGTIVAKNVYAGGSATACYQGTISKTTCASSDTTGTAGLQSIAVNTTNFTNVTADSEDFHLPQSSALIGVGTNLYNDATYPFQTDIDGQTRSGAWDIGADQYVASGAAFLYIPFKRNSTYLRR